MEPKASRWLQVLLCLAMLLTIVSCTSGVASAIEEKETALAATATARSRAAEDQEARTKTSGELRITLLELQATDEGLYVSPKEGYVFLLLNVALENEGQSEVVVGSRHMRLVGADGTVYPMSLYGGSKAAPASSLGPGEKTQGEIAYEVPKGLQAANWLVRGGDAAPEVALELAW